MQGEDKQCPLWGSGLTQAHSQIGKGTHVLEERPLNHSAQQGSRDQKPEFPDFILKYAGIPTPEATSLPAPSEGSSQVGAGPSRQNQSP